MLLRCLLLTLLGACSTRTLELATSPSRDADLPDAQTDAGEEDALISDCNGRSCQCNNGQDDDGDGLIDGFDPDCSYELDDDERSFATGPHDEMGLRGCQDCFFDSNANFDEGCKRAASCRGDDDVKPMGCGSACAPSDACIANCVDRTPNGCDCFGCCEVHLDNQVRYVRLQKECSYDAMLLRDERRCPPCVQSQSCRNPCEECELCLGKTPDKLPAGCANDYTCAEGTPCGASNPCPDSGYCYQGCCLPPILW